MKHCFITQNEIKDFSSYFGTGPIGSILAQLRREKRGSHYALAKKEGIPWQEQQKLEPRLIATL
jgi:hypothetical protein